MKRLLLSLSFVVVLGAVEARAQELKTDGTVTMPTMSLSQLTPTPDMWFYEQASKQYSDPKYLVRKKAEFDTWQRKMRLASCQWYGISNKRPTASVTPHVSGMYANTWVSNSVNPMQWSGGRSSTSTVIVQPTVRTASTSYGLW